MVKVENAPRDLSPEGLTPNQEKLVQVLFDVRQIAPITRRIQLADGTYRFDKIQRLTSPIDFAQEGEFAIKEHEEHPEAPLTPLYVNLRNLPPILEDQIGLVLAETINETADFCSGIPNAGTPLARAYSKYSGIPEADVFEKLETPQGRRIIANKGFKASCSKVRIVDDVAAQGNTKLEAIKAAESLGLTVVDVLVVVDRQQGAIENFAKAGYGIKAAVKLDQILKYGVRTGRISTDQYQQTIDYIQANRASSV